MERERGVKHEQTDGNYPGKVSERSCNKDLCLVALESHVFFANHKMTAMHIHSLILHANFWSCPDLHYIFKMLFHVASKEDYLRQFRASFQLNATKVLLFNKTLSSLMSEQLLRRSTHISRSGEYEHLNAPLVSVCEYAVISEERCRAFYSKTIFLPPGLCNVKAGPVYMAKHNKLFHTTN